MPSPPNLPRGYLPRLAADFYRGDAVVFWTHAVKDRGRGWLDDNFHRVFRELMLHAAVREQLLCPSYALMPDHLHLVWMGVAAESDQRRATAFLRPRLEVALAPHRLQHQAFDHVLRPWERRRKAFAAVCDYISDNPVRAGLTARPDEWPYTGCIVAGYPDLNPLAADFWEIFWRIYDAKVSLVTSAATATLGSRSSVFRGSRR